MDRIRNISSERENLGVHVDLCQQRWEIVHKKMDQLRLICWVLLIEASISTAAVVANPTLLPMLRDFIRSLI
jgi:hypothetical protein